MVFLVILKKIDADVKKKIKNYRLYMAGIKQKQKCLISVEIPSKNERLGGSKKFIRSGLKRKVLNKEKMVASLRIIIMMIYIVSNSNSSNDKSNK